MLKIEKDIVREVARGDKHYLRKSADRKAQISEAFVPQTPLIFLRFLLPALSFNKASHLQAFDTSGTPLVLADDDKNVWTVLITAKRSIIESSCVLVLAHGRILDTMAMLSHFLLKREALYLQVLTN